MTQKEQPTLLFDICCCRDSATVLGCPVDPVAPDDVSTLVGFVTVDTVPLTDD